MSEAPYPPRSLITLDASKCATNFLENEYFIF
jgi:hypothetical protein